MTTVGVTATSLKTVCSRDFHLESREVSGEVWAPDYYHFVGLVNYEVGNAWT